MPKPHLLMIGGWNDIIEKAFDNGFDVSYFGSLSPAVAFDPALLAPARHKVALNVAQIGVCLATARQIHAEEPFDAVISFTELGMETAAVIADALQVPGMDLWAVSVTRYKDKMREVLDKHPHLKLPWQRFSATEQLIDFYQAHGPSIIVKPISGAASVGVQQIRSVEELQGYISAVPEEERVDFIAEQLVDSDQLYSIESLSVDGEHHIITMSVARMVGYPYALSNHIIVPPHNLDERTSASIERTVREFLTAVRLRNGVAHTEVKLSRDHQPFIIESQTRVGGDRIWKMLELTTGVKQVDLTLNNLVGEKQVPVPSAMNQVAAFFSLLPDAGVVARVSDIEDLKSIGGLIEATLEVKVGDDIKPITNNSERKGNLLLTADSHDDLFKKFAQIQERLWIEYENGSVWHPSFK
ncbi:ATP-grasp domain-containing protein [Pseudomonas purpurea]|uniref:ATP-grasp domain-containing protein n=1 Tax=Pseudomonas purpurea TaxID=3136737 RepID=UPI0032678BC0